MKKKIILGVAILSIYLLGFNITNATTTYPGCTFADITLSNGQTWASCDVNNGVTFTWDEAKIKCENGYHLPSLEEWKKTSTVTDLSVINFFSPWNGYWANAYWSNDNFNTTDAFWWAFNGMFITNNYIVNNSNHTLKVYKMRTRCIKDTGTIITTQSTVTFNANGGGTPSFATKTVTGSTAIGTLPTISRTGYTFNGWFTQLTGGTQITTSTIITSNTTYYAHWTAVPTTTTYPGCTSADITLSNGQTWASCDAGNGNKFTWNDAKLKCENGYHLPSFNEWSTANTSLSLYHLKSLLGLKLRPSNSYWTSTPSSYSPNDKATIIGFGTGDGIRDVTRDELKTTTQYIRCIKDTGAAIITQSTVTFNANGGGTPSFPTKTVTGSTAIGTLPTISRTGYTFDGWFTQITGGTQVTTSTIITSNTTYYAHWTASTVIPTFTCGSAISAGGFIYTTKLGPDGKCWTSQNMQHLPLSGASNESWCPNNTQSGCTTYGRLYSFNATIGKATGITSTSTEDTTKSVCGQLGTGWILPSETHFEALKNAGATGWIGNKLSGIISTLPGYYDFNSNGFGPPGYYGIWRTSNNPDSTLSHNYILSYTGSIAVNNNSKNYGFSVICIKDTGTTATNTYGSCTYTGSQTFYYKINNSCYSTAFNCTGGNRVRGPQFSPAPPQPQSGAQLYNTSNECEGITTIKQYTITFTENGGGTPSFPTKTVTGTTVIVIGTLPTISRTGYTFDGWFTQAIGGTQVTTSTIITSNTTYYAHWTASTANTTYGSCTYTGTKNFYYKTNGSCINAIFACTGGNWVRSAQFSPAPPQPQNGAQIYTTYTECEGVTTFPEIIIKESITYVTVPSGYLNYRVSGLDKDHAMGCQSVLKHENVPNAVDSTRCNNPANFVYLKNVNGWSYHNGWPCSSGGCEWTSTILGSDSTLFAPGKEVKIQAHFMDSRNTQDIRSGQVITIK